MKTTNWHTNFYNDLSISDTASFTQSYIGEKAIFTVTIAIIGSKNGSSCVWRQAIIYINVALLITPSEITPN